MVDVPKLKLDLKVSNAAFEVKGSIGLDEFKMKSRFDKNQDQESWCYSKYNGIVNDDYTRDKIYIRKVQLNDGPYDKRISMIIEFPVDKLYMSLVILTNIKEGDHITEAKLYSRKEKIDEVFSTEKLAIKYLSVSINIDKDLNENHKIATKYMNGDWYMREDKINEQDGSNKNPL